MKKLSILCDHCLKAWDRKTIATRVCVTCGCDLCSNDSCDAKSYFDKYVPYQLDRKMAFCPDCAKSIDRLKPVDVADWLPDVRGKYDFAKCVHDWIQNGVDKAHEQVQKEAEAFFAKAIKRSQDRYANDLRLAQEKSEINKKITQLEDEKRALEKRKTAITVE